MPPNDVFVNKDMDGEMKQFVFRVTYYAITEKLLQQFVYLAACMTAEI